MIGKPFFARDTETVAKDLLGCVVEKDGMRGRIVETEAYLKHDAASHAYPEKTERNRLMYETHGHIYVYLCYGIHHMLNFTTDNESVGGVLIRALEPIEGIEGMRDNRGIEEVRELCNGPGKICEAMGIDKEINGTEVGKNIRLESGEADFIETSKRIGISKAVNRELRFYLSNSSYLSKSAKN